MTRVTQRHRETRQTDANALALGEAGTVLFATSGTAAVTFATAQPDTNYYITLGGDTSEDFTWATKTTSGFTCTSDNASSVANCDWVIRRND